MTIPTNIINDLLQLYKAKVENIFYHIQDYDMLTKVHIAYGMLMTLKILKIDPTKIGIYNRTLQDDIDDILKEYTKSTLNKKTEEDKLHDFIHDKDDVGFREYVSSGERNSL